MAITPTLLGQEGKENIDPGTVGIKALHLLTQVYLLSDYISHLLKQHTQLKTLPGSTLGLDSAPHQDLILAEWTVSSTSSRNSSDLSYTIAMCTYQALRISLLRQKE